MPDLSPFPFPNPATPDLDCFVRRKHPLEVEPFNVHVEFQPSIDLPELRQQSISASCAAKRCSFSACSR